MESAAEQTPAVQTTFRRKEKKYLLNQAQYEWLRTQFADYMTVDHHGISTVSSLFYDTAGFDLIHRSIEKPMYKEKFRLRCYNPEPTEESLVFAEIKKKYDGIVYKRRTAAPLREMRAFLDGQADLSDDWQIQQEIRWMFRCYDMAPAVFIAYERTALFGNQDPELRITFDSNLRYRTDRLDLTEGTDGKLFMPETFHVMEIKFPGSAPLWLTGLLGEANIIPGTFSKVGVCFRKEIFPALQKTKIIGGSIC